MTPAVRAYLLELLADHHRWYEATREHLAAHGLATDSLEAMLLEIAEVEREINQAGPKELH